MQMVKKILIVLLGLPFVIMIFMPKQELYYLLEQKLNEQNIIISGETLEENLFGLTITNPVVYISGVSVATVGEVNIWSLLFYTKVNITDLKIAEGLPGAFTVDTSSMMHHILSPVDIEVSGEGNTGSVSGNIRLDQRRIHLNLDDRFGSTILKKELKKNEKGWYYESKF